jgi:hypothetical protein
MKAAEVEKKIGMGSGGAVRTGPDATQGGRGNGANWYNTRCENRPRAGHAERRMMAA